MASIRSLTRSAPRPTSSFPSTSLLLLPADQHIGTSSSALTFHAVARPYATKAAAVGSGGKKVAGASRGSKPGSDAGDSKLEAVKKALLESSPTDEDRLKALQAVLPPLEAHETIERAYKLLLRNRREAHSAEMERKYTAMRSALEVLEQTDKTLFEKATRGREKGEEGLVPRRARIPLDLTSGAVTWDAEWKAPVAAKK